VVFTASPVAEHGFERRQAGFEVGGLDRTKRDAGEGADRAGALDRPEAEIRAQQTHLLAEQLEDVACGLDAGRGRWRHPGRHVDAVGLPQPGTYPRCVPNIHWYASHRRASLGADQQSIRARGYVVELARRRLCRRGLGKNRNALGGCQIRESAGSRTSSNRWRDRSHESLGLELGVHVLVAPGPDRRR
jgi:hypothetical protein